MKHTILLAAILAMTQNAAADSLWWGYGDGESILRGHGSSSSATWTAAVRMPQSVAATYDGASISAVRFAVYGNNQGARDCSYFVTDDIMDIRNAIPVGDLSAGWHEFELDEPYTISAGKDIYIGYIATGAYPVAIVDGVGSEGTCVVGMGSNFIDYGAVSGFNWVLGIQAQLTDGAFAPSLLWTDNGVVRAEADRENSLEFSLQSASPAVVSSFDAELQVGDEVVDARHVTCDLDEAYAAASVSFTLPAYEVGNYAYRVAVTAINGEALSVPVESSGTLEVVKYLMKRRHVVEEVTGTWCGWCVRGIVAMRMMREKYPDRFIGIAVHGRDSYATSSYNGLIDKVSGYPDAFINRSASFDPSPSLMEATFLAEDSSIKGEVNIIEARFTDAARQSLAIRVQTRFVDDYSTESFRLAFVVVEDSLRSVQSNYYANGENGPMGGFENQGSSCYVTLMDVARDIKSFSGIQGSVPADITAGEVYEYTYIYALPANIANIGNVSVVALLQNKSGTKIENADRTENLLDWDAGMSGIETRHNTKAADQMMFDLTGRRIIQPAAGASSKLLIQQGCLRLQP